MKNFRKEVLVFILTIFLSVNATSQDTKSSVTGSDIKVEKKFKKKNKKKEI